MCDVIECIYYLTLFHSDCAYQTTVQLSYQMLHKQYYTENNKKQDDLRLGVQYLNPLLQYRTVTKKIFDLACNMKITF